MAHTDPVYLALAVQRLQPWLPAIAAGAELWGRDPFDLAGICLRETEAGWAKGYAPQGSADGWGDDPDGDGPLNPNGYGLFQIDRRWHAQFLARVDRADPQRQAEYASHVLYDDQVYLLHHLPTLRNADRTMDLRRAVIASFNAGPGHVLHQLNTGADIDTPTTGHDYSLDVVQRADALRAYRPDLFYVPPAGPAPDLLVCHTQLPKEVA